MLILDSETAHLVNEVLARNHERSPRTRETENLDDQPCRFNAEVTSLI